LNFRREITHILRLLYGKGDLLNMLRPIGGGGRPSFKSATDFVREENFSIILFKPTIKQSRRH